MNDFERIGRWFFVVANLETWLVIVYSNKQMALKWVRRWYFILASQPIHSLHKVVAAALLDGDFT